MTQRNEEQTRRYSVEEYLRLEHDSTVKHEFRDGQLIDMSGGTLEHSLIIANFIRELGTRLRRSPCRVYDSNLRVRIAKKVRYAYPDVSVICGEAEFDPADRNRMTVTNPRVVVEVLSPSTEAYDRGEKFRRYLELQSLEEYILVSQCEPRVEALYRQSDGTWLLTMASGMDAIAPVRSMKIELPLVEVYSGVSFPVSDEEEDEGA